MGAGQLLNHRNANLTRNMNWVSCAHGCIFIMHSPHEIPISLASCNKQQVSVTSELQHNNVDSLFDLRGHIHNGPSLLCLKKKISISLTLEHTFHEVLIHFCLLKEISNERQGAFLLLDGEDAKNKFCRNALHVQILYQNALASSTLYANLCRNFMPC